MSLGPGAQTSKAMKGGSKSVHIGLDSRFRGNDRHRVIFERAERGIWP
jgi:hypothetical protein